MVSTDGKAAIGVVTISADLSGLALNDHVVALRKAAHSGLPPGLEAHVTGGPAFGADIANAFAHANITLLAVTASVVALLLIATYRSPVLWLVPLLVIGLADRTAAAVGTAVASATGLGFDGATSGITSVLVFGAGTNYALLLISRYRQELRRVTDHREALRRAVRMAGPAILASNATVVLALLTMILAVSPSTRSLGALAACALVVAAVSVLVVLPAVLALCGRRLFWPLIPHAGTDTDGAALESGPWHRVAEWGGPSSRRGCGGRDRAAGHAGDWPAEHRDRAVTHRAISGSGRFCVRVRRRGEAFSRRPDQPNGGRGRRCPGTSGAGSYQRDPGCGLGDRDGSVNVRADKVVGNHRRAAVIRPGIQHRCGTAEFHQSRLPRCPGGRTRCARARRPRCRAARSAGADPGNPGRYSGRPVCVAALRAGAPDPAGRNDFGSAGRARDGRVGQPARVRFPGPGPQHTAVRVSVPGRPRRGLHHLPGHPRPRGATGPRRT